MVRAPDPHPLAPELARRLEEIQAAHGRAWDIRPCAWPPVDGVPWWWVATRRPHAERPRGHVDQERSHTCGDLEDMAVWLDWQSRIYAGLDEAPDSAAAAR